MAASGHVNCNIYVGRGNLLTEINKLALLIQCKHQVSIVVRAAHRLQWLLPPVVSHFWGVPMVLQQTLKHGRVAGLPVVRFNFKLIPLDAFGTCLPTSFTIGQTAGFLASEHRQWTFAIRPAPHTYFGIGFSCVRSLSLIFTLAAPASRALSPVPGFLLRLRRC